MKDLLTKAGLTEEQVSGIISAMTEAKLYTTKEQNIEQRYAKLKTQKQDLESNLVAANETIEGLKQSNLANDNLQKEVELYKNKVIEIEAAAKQKVHTLTLDNAINAKLGEFDVKYHALLGKAFDRDTLKIDENGNVLGLDEQFTSIKDTYKELLTPNVVGRVPQNPTNTPKGITKEEFSKMSYTDRVDLFNTQPEVYSQLTE